jgi:hypothetical protein
MLCNQIVPIVNGLEKEYGDRLGFAVVPHNDGDAPARIERYGLDIHGMVITDQDDRVIWSESGHKQTRQGVRQAIDKALGG